MGQSLTLEQQFDLPLVKDLLDENRRITKNLSTKLPDNKIEDISVPFTFKHKLLMAPGTHNEIFYSKESIEAKVELAEGAQLYLDHKDTSGEGALNWIGSISNPVYELGDQGEGMYGDLIIVDKSSAQKLAAGAKLGISPTIDFDRTDFGETTSASDLNWKSFSLVSSPAIRATMLNSNGGGKMPTEPVQKIPYKFPTKGDNGETVMDTIQLSDKKAVEILTKRDAKISELEKANKDMAAKLEKFETAQKADLVANLAANEFLVGRLEANEYAERTKELMEKSPEILSEVGKVIGEHSELQKFKEFGRDFLSKNPGKTITDTALAWTAAKEKGTATMDAAKGTATLENASLTKPAGTEPGRVISELGSGILQSDQDMYNMMVQDIPGGRALE